MNYRHYNTEIWFPKENSTNLWEACVRNEEKDCSDSVPIYKIIPDNHNWYVGINMNP